MDRSVYSDLIFTNVVFTEGKMSSEGKGLHCVGIAYHAALHIAC